MELKNLLNSEGVNNPVAHNPPPQTDSSFQSNLAPFFSGQNSGFKSLGPNYFLQENWPNGTLPSSILNNRLNQHNFQSSMDSYEQTTLNVSKMIDRYQKDEIKNELALQTNGNSIDFNDPSLISPSIYSNYSSVSSVWKPEAIESVTSEISFQDLRTGREIERTLKDFRSHSPTNPNDSWFARDINLMHQQTCRSSKLSSTCLGCSHFWKSVQQVQEEIKPWGLYDLLHHEIEHTETFSGNLSMNGSYSFQQRGMISLDYVNTLFYCDDPNMVAIWGLISPTELNKLTEGEPMGFHVFEQKNFFDPINLEKKVKIIYAIQKQGQTIVIPSMWSYFVIYKGNGIGFSASWYLLRAKNLADARRNVEINRTYKIYYPIHLSSLAIYATYHYLDEFETTQSPNEKRIYSEILAKLVPLLKVQVLEELLGERVNLSLLAIMGYTSILEKFKRNARKQLGLSVQQNRDWNQIRSSSTPLPSLEHDMSDDEEDGKFYCYSCKYILFHSRRSCNTCKDYDLCESCYAAIGKFHPHKMKKYKMKFSVSSLIDLVEQVNTTLDEFEGVKDREREKERELERDRIREKEREFIKRKKREKPKLEERKERDDDENFEDEVIDCICGNNKDLGFMISCEKCFAWLHGKCVGISKRNEPDEYYCPRCVKKQQSEKKRTPNSRGNSVMSNNSMDQTSTLPSKKN